MRGFRAPTVTHLAGSRAALGKMMHSRVEDQACASRPRLLTWALALFHHYYCMCVFTQGERAKVPEWLIEKKPAFRLRLSSDPDDSWEGGSDPSAATEEENAPARFLQPPNRLVLAGSGISTWDAPGRACYDSFPAAGHKPFPRVSARGT